MLPARGMRTRNRSAGGASGAGLCPRAQDEGGGGSVVDLVVGLVAALIEAIDPIAAAFEAFERLGEVADAATGRYSRAAGGGLGDGIGQADGSPFRDHHGAQAGGVRGADDGAQVVRVFDAVEKQEAGAGREIVEIQVLVAAPRAITPWWPRRGQTVQGVARLEAEGHGKLAAEATIS